MRFLVFMLLITVAANISGRASAVKETQTSGSQVVGAWKASADANGERTEVGVFVFRPDGRFALERDHFLDLVKGTYAADSKALKLTATEAADGAPLDKGPWPLKTRSISGKEIVLELAGEGRTAVIRLTRLPIPEAALQAIEQDRKKLQGTWKHVGTEQNGKPVNDKEAPTSMTFLGEKVRHPGESEYGIFTLSATRKLKSFQARFSNGEGLANLFAYELDGDRLRLCRSPGQAFPQEFKTEGTKNRIEEYKRVIE